MPTSPTLAEHIENRNETNTETEKTESLESLPQTLTLTFEALDDQKAQDYINNWLGDIAEIEEKKNLAKNQNKVDPIKLGVLLAPQTISNATQPVNLGAGMMSEFSFSKRLKLDVGLAYARQQITPTNSNRNWLSSSEAFHQLMHWMSQLYSLNLQERPFQGIL